MHNLLKPFMLRRLKADVEICLPRKQEILLYAPMTKEQHRINEQLLDKSLMVSRLQWMSDIQGSLVGAFWCSSRGAAACLCPSLVHVSSQSSCRRCAAMHDIKSVYVRVC